MKTKREWIAGTGLTAAMVIAMVAQEAFASGYDGDQSGMLVRLERAIAEGQVLFPLALAMLAGFLTSLSPCIYPIIPITLSIMGAGRYQSHWHGFMLSLSYVFGMSILYTALGAIFASFGMMLGSFMQHPIAVGAVALIFLTMGLSSLGLFSIALPQSITNRLVGLGGRGAKGAFIMGLVAGLVAMPCTGPVVGFILTLISSSAPSYGIGLMASFSMGLGAPFLLLGTFSSALVRLPRSGPWLDSIKVILGAAMVGVAIYYASLAISSIKALVRSTASMHVGLLLLVLLIGVVLLALGPSLLPKKTKIHRSIGAALTALAVASLLSHEMQSPATSMAMEGGLSWHVIDETASDDALLDRLLNEAAADGRPALIDFFADWCVSCHRLERITFSAKPVSDLLRGFSLIRVNATTSSATLDRIQSRYGVVGLPTVLIFDHGEERARITGFVEPDAFLKIIDDLR